MIKDNNHEEIKGEDLSDADLSTHMYDRSIKSGKGMTYDEEAC